MATQRSERSERNRRQRIRRRKRILRRFIQAEVLAIVALAAFMIGRKVGVNSARAQIAASAAVGSQVYGAGQNGNAVSTVEYLKDEEDRISGPDADPVIEKREISSLWEEQPELILVNKEHKLPEDYEVTLKKLPDGTNRAAEIAYQPMCDMLKAGRKAGLAFEVCSSYRSVERQQELLDEDINALVRKGYTYQEAYDEVTMETMPPGYSEHATGLAFDIVALDYQMLDSRQKNTDENKWLLAHCAEYGFILRYPEDKEEVTGISYESWHFRYVGVEAAEYIMEKGITLEEYLEELLDKML